MGPWATSVEINTTVGRIGKRLLEGCKSGVPADLLHEIPLLGVHVAKVLQPGEGIGMHGGRIGGINSNVTKVPRHGDEENQTVNVEEISAERHLAVCL